LNLDDTFVNFDNLLKFLGSKDPQVPTFYGYNSRFTDEYLTNYFGPNHGFNTTVTYTTGGPGFAFININ
jgi:hypothetical protein